MKLYIYAMTLFAIIGSGVAVYSDPKKDDSKNKAPGYTPQRGSRAEKCMHNFAKQYPAWKNTIKTREGRLKWLKMMTRNDLQWW